APRRSRLAARTRHRRDGAHLPHRGDVLFPPAAAMEPDIPGSASHCFNFVRAAPPGSLEPDRRREGAMNVAAVASLGRHRRLLILFALTLVTWSSAALLVPGFTTGASSRNILLQVVALAIIAGGQTVVIIAGGIDLSIPWMTSVAAVLLTD